MSFFLGKQESYKKTVEEEIQREWKALCRIEITIEHISGKQAIELVNKNYQDLF